MACSSRACFALATMLTVLSLSSASTFKVGGKDGWTSFKNVNYTKWSNSIHFQAGDLLSKYQNLLFYKTVNLV